MSGTTNSLHMLQLSLDSKRLWELGRMLRLPLRDADPGYLIHCALGELFGDNAPATYWVDRKPGAGQHVDVLAYSELELDTLQQLASGLASPKVYSILDWQRSASKPMPTKFPEGMVVAFSARVCPIVRLSSATGHYKRGAEVDAFLAACAKVDEETDVDREETYIDWFKRRGELDCVEITQTSMEEFALSKMLRRGAKATNGKRGAKPIVRPDVTIEGKLEIKDSEAFAKTLARGIGRHRGFGFGMLRLRRASR